MSVKQRAGESTSGFLEEQEAIAVEPSYIPVLALGAVLHEWGHLLAEGWRFDQAVRAAADSGEIAAAGREPLAGGGHRRGVDRPRAWPRSCARLPLVGLAEAEKRVRLSGNELDPHVTGYLVARAAIDAAAATGNLRTGDASGTSSRPASPRRSWRIRCSRATFRDPGDVAPLIIPGAEPPLPRAGEHLHRRYALSRSRQHHHQDARVR